MSSNETPREEPKFDAAAPSIVPAANDEKAPEAVAADAARSEAPAEKLPEAPKLELPEPKVEPEQKPETTITLLPALRTTPEQKKEFEGPEILVKPRSSARFGLLAACVAIAASFGAVAGSLSVAKLQPMFAAAPPPPVQIVQPAPKDNADELKALKDTVTQLRSATRALSEQVASLKTSVSSSNNAQNAQITKLSETIDRVEKSQSEQRRAAATTTNTTAAVAQRQAAADVTGSVAKPQTQQASQQPDAQAALRQSVVQGWVLRRVYDGAALIEGRDGIIEVEPGEIAPGLGRIEGIKRQDGRWVVVTSRGLVVGR
jgi:hypothetical protein